jgi:hypothetical protein
VIKQAVHLEQLIPGIAGMKFTVVLFLSVRVLLAQSVAIQDPSDPLRARLLGIVLNERGQPAVGVTVQATPPGPLAARLPHTQTDVEGRFALAGLLPGHTYVNAFDEEAFYPNATLNFWDQQGAAEIELPVGQEVSGIILTVRPVGRLEVKARNAASGADVDQITIRLERDGAPNRWLEGSKQGNWWLVPTVPVRLCVSANGFEPTWYGGNGSFPGSMPITVTPRQIFTATVSLQPLARGAARDTTCFSRRSP